MNEETQKQMQDLHDTFQQEVLPRFKEKYTKKYDELKRQLDVLREENNQVNNDLAQQRQSHSEL